MLIIRVDYDADPRLVDKSALAEHQQWVEILSEQKSCPPTANAHLLNYRLFSESLRSLQSDGRISHYRFGQHFLVNRSRQFFQGCKTAILRGFQGKECSSAIVVRRSCLSKIYGGGPAFHLLVFPTAQFMLQQNRMHCSSFPSFIYSWSISHI